MLKLRPAKISITQSHPQGAQGATRIPPCPHHPPTSNVALFSIDEGRKPVNLQEPVSLSGRDKQHPAAHHPLGSLFSPDWWWWRWWWRWQGGYLEHWEAEQSYPLNQPPQPPAGTPRCCEELESFLSCEKVSHSHSLHICFSFSIFNTGAKQTKHNKGSDQLASF